MPCRDPIVRRRRDRDRHRRRVETLIAAGLCVRCGHRAPVEGGRTCETCRRKRRDADRARAERRRDAGIRRVRDPESRAAEYARSKRRAAERQTAGKCVKCGRFPHEPERRLCAVCGERARQRDRERYAQARARGLAYGGRRPDAKRATARRRSRTRRRRRLEAGLCVRCGRRPPVNNGSSCEPCLQVRRAADKAAYRSRRSLGHCVRCAAATFDGERLCGPCTVIRARRQPARNAAARQRYADRVARQVCTQCGTAPSFGASRCDNCARKAYARSEHVRGLPVFAAEFTVVHAGTAELLGVFEDWEDVVLCLAFAGLEFDEVDVLTEHAPMRPVLTGFS